MAAVMRHCLSSLRREGEYQERKGVGLFFASFVILPLRLCDEKGVDVIQPFESAHV